jgi:hypothetical protein
MHLHVNWRMHILQHELPRKIKHGLEQMSLVGEFR